MSSMIKIVKEGKEAKEEGQQIEKTLVFMPFGKGGKRIVMLSF